MVRNLYEEIIYSADIELIKAMQMQESVLHIICNSGDAAFEYNGNRFRLECNDIAVISRPKFIGNVEVGEGFSCEFIAAPDKFLHNLLPANSYAITGGVSLFDNPVIRVEESDAVRFRRDIANIRARIGDCDHSFYREMIGGLLQTMIYDLFDFHMKGTEGSMTTDRVGYITNHFFTLLEAGKPKTEREVAFYAAQLNVSSKYLSDTIKRVTGLSASAHINRAATAIIIDYLRGDELSITQIADEMEFTSVSYFSRFCSKHIGVSPSRFRTSGGKSNVIANP